jgi:type IV pilus assembly protein PilC
VPSFRYEAKDQAGRTVSGAIEAPTQEAAVRQVRAQGYWVVRLDSQYQVSELGGGWDRVKRQILAPVFRPVGSKPLAMFFASFSALLGAGMNLYEAAEALAHRTRNRVLRQAATEIAAAAQNGEPIAAVFVRHPAAFKPFVVALIETGQETGLLDEAMGKLAEYFDRTHELEMTFRLETFYTKLVLALVIIIPTFLPFAEQVVVKGVWLPFLKTLLFNSSGLLLAIGAIWYGYRLLTRWPPVAQAVDRVKLSLPWFGSIARRFAVAKWARSMAMLSDAGVPIGRCLEASAAASGNAAIAASLTREADRVRRGESVTQVMEASREFPGLTVDMMAIAERSGSVSAAMNKVATYYESETGTEGKMAAITVGIVFYLAVAAVVAYVVISFWVGYFSGLDL